MTVGGVDPVGDAAPAAGNRVGGLGLARSIDRRRRINPADGLWLQGNWSPDAHLAAQSMRWHPRVHLG